MTHTQTKKHRRRTQPLRAEKGNTVQYGPEYKPPVSDSDPVIITDDAPETQDDAPQRFGAWRSFQHLRQELARHSDPVVEGCSKSPTFVFTVNATIAGLVLAAPVYESWTMIYIALGLGGLKVAFRPLYHVGTGVAAIVHLLDNRLRK